MAYIKIDPDTFEEILPNRRILIRDINDRIDLLIIQRGEMAAQATMASLPFEREKDRIIAEIQALRDLKQELLAM